MGNQISSVVDGSVCNCGSDRKDLRKVEFAADGTTITKSPSIPQRNKLVQDITPQRATSPAVRRSGATLQVREQPTQLRDAGGGDTSPLSQTPVEFMGDTFTGVVKPVRRSKSVTRTPPRKDEELIGDDSGGTVAAGASPRSVERPSSHVPTEEKSLLDTAEKAKRKPLPGPTEDKQATVTVLEVKKTPCADPCRGMCVRVGGWVAVRDSHGLCLLRWSRWTPPHRSPQTA